MRAYSQIHFLAFVQFVVHISSAVFIYSYYLLYSAIFCVQFEQLSNPGWLSIWAYLCRIFFTEMSVHFCFMLSWLTNKVEYGPRPTAQQMKWTIEPWNHAPSVEITSRELATGTLESRSHFTISDNWWVDHPDPLNILANRLLIALCF